MAMKVKKKKVKKKIVQKIVAAAVIFNKENKILILQRSKDEEIFPNIWELPSGKRKFLESCKDCLKREVKEETNLDIEILFPFSVFEYKIEKPNEILDTTQINFLTKVKRNKKIKLSKEHQNFAWVDKKEIKNYKLSKNTKKTILEAFKIVSILMSKK